MAMAVPRFARDRVAQWTEAGEGCVTISSALFPDSGTCDLTPSMRTILDLCDGQRSLSAVYALYAASSSEPPPLDRARADVNELLKSLDRVGLIDWMTGANPFVDDRLAYGWTGQSGTRYRVCGERDLDEITGFLRLFGIPEPAGDETPFPTHHLPISSSRIQYLDVAVRNKIFEFFEVFFFGYQADQPVILLSFISCHPRNKLRCGSLGLVLVRPDVSDPDLLIEEIADFACQRVNSHALGENTKMRMIIPADDSDRDQRVRVAKAMRFEHQVTLEDELGCGCHAELWDRCVPPEAD